MVMRRAPLLAINSEKGVLPNPPFLEQLLGIAKSIMTF